MLSAVVSLLGLAVIVSVTSNRPNASALKTVPAVQKIEPAVAEAPVDIIPGRPVRLQIPRLQVDAKTDSLGLTKSGDMASPNNIADAGWYKLGTMPGNEGSAVIAGHKTGFKGEPGLFTNLGKLREGDIINTIDEKNQVIRFVVREVKNYEQNENSSEVFTSLSGAHLNLITCTGSWSKTTDSFSERLVVFTDKVPR